jgi:hypothetical protein
MAKSRNAYCKEDPIFDEETREEEREGKGKEWREGKRKGSEKGEGMGRVISRICIPLVAMIFISGQYRLALSYRTT